MLKFWKNAGRGKSKFPTRPPESSDSYSPTGLSHRNSIDESYQRFDLENIDNNEQEERVYCESSRLSKTLMETVSDKQSLGYFIEYMESISLRRLVEFWMEVEAFKVSVKFLDISQKSNSLPRKKIGRTVSFDSSLQCNGCSEAGEDFDIKRYPSCSIKMNGISEPGKMKNKVLDIAVAIFKKYIALESPYKLDIPDDVRNAIVSLICHPEGLVDPNIFKVAQQFVYDQMFNHHFEKYTQSNYHCKYQIDILTSGSLTIEDIIYNQMALFYFMEFLEQEQCSLLLEFIMAVVNFKQHLKTSVNYDPEQAQNDAIILYDKYFSLQATNSLGFSSEIRFNIEESICQEGGPSPDCFHKPFRLVLKALQQHITSFLTSQLYYQYLSEMVSSVQSNWQSVKKHKKSASDCSSEISVSTRNNSIMGESSARSVSGSSMRIDLKQLYRSDTLWRRKSDKGLCLGRVNSLGRFESTMEPDPEKKDPSILKRVVSKFVHGDNDKAKEELAWQVAHMIIKDVTDVTMGIPEGQL